MHTTIAELAKMIRTKRVPGDSSASIAPHSSREAMFPPVTHGKPPNAPCRTPLEVQPQTPIPAPRGALSEVRLRHPVYDRNGAVIGLSAKPTQEPETVYDRATVFVGLIGQDERWAGRYVLARVLRELYRGFSRGMAPINWRSVAIEIRNIPGLAVVYKHVHEGGRDRRLQAYEIPDFR